LQYTVGTTFIMGGRVTLRNLTALVLLALAVSFAATGCARTSVPATAPEVSEAPPVGEVTLYDAPCHLTPLD
jgi:hypothetical protein